MLQTELPAAGLLAVWPAAGCAAVFGAWLSEPPAARTQPEGYYEWLLASLALTNVQMIDNQAIKRPDGGSDANHSILRMSFRMLNP